MIDRRSRCFEVFGPTNDDLAITQMIVELYEAGFDVNTCNRPRRSATETKRMVVEEVARELRMQHREGLLWRLRAWA